MSYLFNLHCNSRNRQILLILTELLSLQYSYQHNNIRNGFKDMSEERKAFTHTSLVEKDNYYTGNPGRQFLFHYKSASNFLYASGDPERTTPKCQEKKKFRKKICYLFLILLRFISKDRFGFLFKYTKFMNLIQHFQNMSAILNTNG